ncbi:MAG: hypothetical protein K2I99_04400, partial [Bacteroidaceae bacterium]|nr:hypothetical protein [Bacteroidaceae bacterium]
MRQVLLLWLCWIGALAAMCAQEVDSPYLAVRTDGVSSVLDSAYLAQIDSVMQLYEQMERQRQVEQVIHRFEEQRLKKEMSMDFSGVLPLARGMLLTWTDHNFMTHPAQFEPKRGRCNWIDYGVAATPLLANWVMKAAGVKSRSKLERMLTANAMALGLSFGVTELLKSTVNETRPDLSDNRTFSSGHASFAFVAATVLHREYGYISPWISVGGY